MTQYWTKPDDQELLHFIGADEIQRLLKRVMRINRQGQSAYSDYTFEDGIEATILWLTGDGQHPFGDADRSKVEDQ